MPQELCASCNSTSPEEAQFCPYCGTVLIDQPSSVIKAFQGDMLEWQALEDLIGAARTGVVMEFKRQDHYKALYATVMENRRRMENFLKRFNVKW